LNGERVRAGTNYTLPRDDTLAARVGLGSAPGRQECDRHRRE
jgi:hypothetical protein